MKKKIDPVSGIYFRLTGMFFIYAVKTIPPVRPRLNWMRVPK